MKLNDLKHWKTLWQIFKPKPKSFFKYHAINENLIKILVNNTLWAGAASELNDPYDCDFDMSQDFFKNKIIDKLSFKDMGISSVSNNDEKMFLDGLSSAFNEEQLKTFQQLTIEDLGVCCFSSKLNLELMWSHYANSGKGVCLEFDFNTSPEFLKKIIPINYSNKSILVNEDIDRVKAFFKKRKAWSYENEWRILNEVGAFSFNKKELIGITFGPRVSKEDFILVLETLKKYDHLATLSKCIYTKSGIEIKQILNPKEYLDKL
jgi:hypothetical protein